VAMGFPVATYFASGFIQNIVGKKAKKREVENVIDFPPTGTIPITVIKPQK